MPLCAARTLCRYVVATDGAEHLFAAQLIEYNWFQRESVDVVLLLVAVVSAVLGVLALIVRVVAKKLCGRPAGGTATASGSSGSKSKSA
jgi:hypothetical protein